MRSENSDVENEYRANEIMKIKIIGEIVKKWAYIKVQMQSRASTTTQFVT